MMSTDKNLPSITLAVTAIHAVLILWIILLPSSTFAPRKKTERLVVKTVQLNPPIPKSVVKTSPPTPPVQIVEPTPIQEPEVAPQPVSLPKVEEPPKAVEEPIKKTEPKQAPIEKKVESKKTEIVKKSVSKKPSSAKKKSVKKPEIVKTTKSAPKKDSVPKTPTPKKVEKPKIDTQLEAAKVKAQQESQEKQKKLIAAAQESIAKIDQSRAKISEAKSSLSKIATVPVAITSLQIDALPLSNALLLTPGEQSYRDELASRLKLMLKLPEQGDVQLKLTLDRGGKAVKVIILKSVSTANRSYVEKTLPSLKFPPFGNHFENMPEYTFIIQLSNET